VLGVLERTPSFFKELFYGGRQLQQPLEIPTHPPALSLPPFPSKLGHAAFWFFFSSQSDRARAPARLLPRGLRPRSTRFEGFLRHVPRRRSLKASSHQITRPLVSAFTEPKTVKPSCGRAAEMGRAAETLVPRHRGTRHISIVLTGGQNTRAKFDSIFPEEHSVVFR
jgi:hypothetical protein